MNNYKNSRNFSNSYRNNYSSNKMYYSQTSEAFKYEPAYAPESSPSIKKRIKKVKKEKYVKVEQKEKHFTARFFATICIFTTITICAVSISAQTIQKRFQIDELNSKLKELKEANKNLETEIAKNLDLEYVEQYATSNLKMQKPASHQIIHINVPKESYTLTNSKTNSNDESFFERFNLLKYLKNGG